MLKCILNTNFNLFLNLLAKSDYLPPTQDFWRTPILKYSSHQLGICFKMWMISEVNCLVLKDISYLMYSSSAGNMYGSMANISCGTGYKFVDLEDSHAMKTAICLATGKWSISLTNDSCEGEHYF